MRLKSRFDNTLFALLFCSAALAPLVVACSSEAELGEACEGSGKTEDECEAGGVCGKPADDSNALQCLSICARDEDCPTGRSCNGVEGTSLKGCRIKK